ncbi:MAG: fructosamine kinase family protein [Pseudomonadota bacterium]
MIWDAIASDITTATGRPFTASTRNPVAGGSVNETWCISGGEERFFVKLNDAALLPMFAAEAEGLRAIADSNTVRAPKPITMGARERSWLVLEYIELQPKGECCLQRLGEQLADMHRSTQASFGWHRDNTIGTTPQINHRASDWVTFFSEHRLNVQLKLAVRRGTSPRLLDLGRRLQERLPQLFTGYSPRPSLLHGDLWGGNWASDEAGNPVLFDPAVYFGDREADLAMTELFGGFGDRFYQSYVNAWDIDPGYQTRKVLYNLYHILNHFNLFGGGYDRQAIDMMNRLITETS